jgi:K+-sensing histidine kinase KdpD
VLAYLPRWAFGYGGGLAAVALVSLFIGLVLGQVNLANSSMLYLLAVMATAVGLGRGPAVFGSVSAFLVFDWFFVAPAHQLTVADPEEWLSLVLFLLTATVTVNWRPDSASERVRHRRESGRLRFFTTLFACSAKASLTGSFQPSPSGCAASLRHVDVCHHCRFHRRTHGRSDPGVSR